MERGDGGTGGTTNVIGSFTTQLNSGDEVYMKRIGGNINFAVYPYSQWGGHLLA